MTPQKALRLTVEQRLGFEITAARAVVEREYQRMQDDLHNLGKYHDSTMIALHEAERVLAALERVNGDYYRRVIEGLKAYREERKREAREAAEAALAHAGNGVFNDLERTESLADAKERGRLGSNDC